MMITDRFSLRTALWATLSLFVAPLSAQQFNISTNPSINSCSGALEDSGSASGEYSNNENFTTVICPEIEGDVTTLQWVVADLDQSGAQNSWDRIRIWDGNNTTATFLGEYTGADNLVGVVFQATTMNPSGCLTVQFISNGSGVGNFAAIISCETPCDRPTAAGSMSEPSIPAKICAGEEVTFSDAGSTAAQGFDIVSYTWDFKDGTTADGQTVTHSWSEPGEYVVQLYVVDDNGCVNTNVIDLQVLVSTTPNFSGAALHDQIGCVGGVVTLNATGTEPTTWTGVPDTGSDVEVTLYDSIGVPFNSTITMTQFLPGQTLTDCADMQSICVDMEHSYMGDLVISLSCPNGQTQVLHQQNGGGTDLGIPGNGVPGTPYNYCWSSAATNGTWVQNAGGGVPTLPAGTYEPLQSCEQLEGCPMNGTWTLTILDLWAADDGNLFGWSLNFNPSIIPDVTEFTPSLGLGSPDSVSWSGGGVVVDPNDPLIATATLMFPGTHGYTFSVIDDFGCAYDTTITITVPETPELDAGPAITLCSDPVPMAAEFIANAPINSCTFNLELYDDFPDAWNSGANINVTVDGVTTNHTVTCCSGLLSIPLAVESGMPISLNYVAGTSWNDENSFTLFNDVGTPLFSSPFDPPSGVLFEGIVTCISGSSPTVVIWSPITGLTDPSDMETDVFVTEPTMFHLTTYPIGFPECAVTDSVMVAPDPSINAGLSAQITICEGYLPIEMTDSLGGTPDNDGVWTTSGGAVVSSGLFDPTTDTPGVFTYTVTSAVGCQATATLSVTVIPIEDPTCCGVIDAGEPAFSCNLSIQLSATRGNTGSGYWTGPPEAQFLDEYDAITTVTMPTGSGGTHRFYWVENDGAFCNLIDSVDMTFTDVYTFDPTFTDAICYSYCDGTARINVTGGNPEQDWQYIWSNGEQGIALDAVDGLCADDYQLIVRDENGCADSLEFSIGEPELLTIDSLSTRPVLCSGNCNGEVVIHDHEAVEYSFDNGTTWFSDSLATGVCEGIAQVKIKNTAGCFGTGAIPVTGPPPVTASFTWTPRPADVEHAQVTFVNTSSGADHWDWNIADLATTTSMAPVFAFNEKLPGIYPVCLIAYNQNECSDTLCLDVVVNDVLYTFIPNAFTPDGDNVNDTWWPSANIPVHKDYELMVFDRWGQVVFNTEDPYMGWQGSYQNGGEILKSDVYAYRLLYGIKDSDVRKEIVGHVTLMK